MPKLNLNDLPRGIGEEEDSIWLKKPQWIIDREENYMKRRLNKIIFPDRNNDFSMGNMTPDAIIQTYIGHH